VLLGQLFCSRLRHLKIANDLRVVGAIATEDDWLVSDVVLIEVFVNETKENLLLLID